MTRAHIMIAPNGARRGKDDHPALPITIPETVEVAAACHAAGADALHLHVRDDQGAHSLDVGLYREALADLARRVPDMPVQVTTESAGLFDVSAQLTCLEQLKPAWASISVREIARAPDLAERVYATCAAQGTRVQHILYDASDAALLQRWRSQGIVRDEQAEVILVLGRYQPPVAATADLLAARLADLPESTPWTLCAFGPHEQACLLAAARQGGALRVGFENNLCHPDGRPWADMAEAVRSLRDALKE